MKNLTPVVKVSATKQIAEQIRQAILDGTLKKDEQLPTEHDLSAHFGVSRPTIREALKRLAAQNMIRSRRGPSGGTFVNNYQVEDAAEAITSSTMLMLSLGSLKISEVIDTRRFMEFHCCQEAMKHWTPAVAEKIDAAFTAIQSKTLTDEQFCDADVHFHRSIIEAAENPMLKFLMYGVIEALVPVMNMMIVYVRDRSVILGYYQELRDGLFNQSQDEVRSALDKLMAYLAEKSREARQIHEAKQASA